MHIFQYSNLKIFLGIVFISLILLLCYLLLMRNKPYNYSEVKLMAVIKLPKPYYSSNTSLEAAIVKRRSVRTYSNKPITIQQISQLLWAAQGITSTNYFRTSPSAGALYPLEIYVVVGTVTNLSSGIYHYFANNNTLEQLTLGDMRKALSTAALSQSAIEAGAATIVIAAVYARTTVKYGTRGERYVHMEAGHAAENIYLQAISLGLGTVAIGAFSDAKVKTLLDLPNNVDPLYLMPIGSLKSSE